MGKKDQFMLKHLKNKYKNFTNDFLNNGDNTFDDIKDDLDEINKGIEIYEKNRNSYKNSPNIQDQVNNSRKIAEGLKKIIKLIESYKFRIIPLSSRSGSSSRLDYIDLSYE